MSMWSGFKPDFPDYPAETPRRQNFFPYLDNGGTVAAIAGNDFAIIGSDTRISDGGYSISTRNASKLFQLTDTTVLGCTGCWCDCLTLNRMIEARMYMYKQENHKTMTTTAAAQMLSTMLYYKRFFPYYTTNILAGLDDKGKGCIFSYDIVGHYEKSNFQACGTAGALLQPFFDNQIGLTNMLNVTEKSISLKRALCILKDAFTFGAERDIYTGDGIMINIITRNGTTEDTFELRRD